MRERCIVNREQEIVSSKWGIGCYPLIRFFTILMKPNNNLKMESKSIEIRSNSFADIKPSAFAKSNKVSNSLADPSAMYRNCCSSLSDLLAAPSAILTGIEVHALRICDVNPNLSSDGKVEVSTYNLLTSSKLCFHTSKFWCGFMSDVFRFSLKLPLWLRNMVWVRINHMLSISSISYSQLPISN